VSATGIGRRREAAAQPPGDALRIAAVAVLGAAVVLELLILRLGTRIAIHVPASEALESPYVLFALAGRYAYYVGVTSLAGLLLLLGARGARSGDLSGWLVAAGVAAFTVAATLLRAGYDTPLVTIGLSVAGVMLAGLAGVLSNWRLAIFLGPLALAVWASGVFTLLQQEGINGAAVSFLPTISEGLVVLIALATPVAFRARLAGAPLVIGSGVGLLVFAMFTANPWTSRILLLWSDGLPGRLPGLAYAIAAAVYVAAIVAVWRRGRVESAVALVLLLAAGVALQNTYQTGLLVVALAIVAVSGGAETHSRQAS